MCHNQVAKYVIVKGPRLVTAVLAVPQGKSTESVVNHYVKRSIAYQMDKRMPSHSWKVAESEHVIDAIIESH